MDSNNFNIKDDLQSGTLFKGSNHLKDLLAKLGFSFDKQADLLQALENESIDARALLLFSPRQLENLIPELTMIDSYRLINEAITLFKGEVTTLSEIIKKSEKRNFISTRVEKLDFKLNGGLPSQKLVELYGSAKTGKTQFFYTLAAEVLSKGKSVVWLDTEGSFESIRLRDNLAFFGYYEGENFTLEEVSDQFFFARVTHASELIGRILGLIPILSNNNVGLIIIDSLVAPIKADYSESSDFKERYLLTSSLLNYLKRMAVVYDLTVCYSNQVFNNFTEKGGRKELPSGGHLLSHASDLRFYLEKIDSKDLDHGEQVRRLSLVDCGWISEFHEFYAIGSFGICSPEKEFKMKGDYEEWLFSEQIRLKQKK
ncbi:MAG: AAA family ATPase [Candidatus Heimdallarchaeota archaeon]|nr:AAA family ATPase [Candidatus Heimdallarchaeota archaeon]MCK5049678.1 AAA family ATPase [Candidatus Heimdallarchaeota archaeon]